MTILEAKQKFLNWWKNQIGYAESANNWTKYAESADLQRLYGWKPQNQPWCDIIYDAGMIECFGLEDASKMTFQPIGQGSAACRFSAAFYSAHGALMNYPEMGDQIFFYDSKGEINHTGIVEAVGGGVVYTIEGNKSDRVQRCSYAIGASTIAGYGRPNWKVVIDATVKPAEPVIEKPSTPAAPEKPVDPTVYCIASIKLPVINYGDKGAYVKLMQQRLMLQTDANGNHPYNCGWYGADGDYGQCTLNSLKKFQKDAGIESDGICGKLTWTVLLGVS